MDDYAEQLARQRALEDNRLANQASAAQRMDNWLSDQAAGARRMDNWLSDQASAAQRMDNWLSDQAAGARRMDNWLSDQALDTQQCIDVTQEQLAQNQKMTDVWSDQALDTQQCIDVTQEQLAQNQKMIDVTQQQAVSQPQMSGESLTPSLASAGEYSVENDGHFRWFHQDLSKWGGAPSSYKWCADATRAMIEENYTLKVGGGTTDAAKADPTQLFQIGRKEYDETDSPPNTADRMYSGYLKPGSYLTGGGINTVEAAEALKYIDAELKNGHPIMVGVTWDSTNTATHPQINKTFNEHITDHYVVITGRRLVNGEPVYTFRDPATGHESNSYGEFHVEDGILVRKGQPGATSSTKARYEVTQVRKNLPNVQSAAPQKDTTPAGVHTEYPDANRFTTKTQPTSEPHTGTSDTVAHEQRPASVIDPEINSAVERSFAENSEGPASSSTDNWRKVSLSPEDLIRDHVITPRAEDVSITSAQMESTQKRLDDLAIRLEADPQNKQLQKQYRSLKERYENFSARLELLDPELKGKPLPGGYNTYAAIQVVDKDGNVLVARGKYGARDEYGNVLHAEEDAARNLRKLLGDPSQNKLLSGSRIDVATDQHVCSDRCRPALTQLSQEYGAAGVEAHVPVRARKTGKGTASPKTTAKTALMRDTPPLEYRSTTLEQAPTTLPENSSTIYLHQDRVEEVGRRPATKPEVPPTEDPIIRRAAPEAQRPEPAPAAADVTRKSAPADPQPAGHAQPRPFVVPHVEVPKTSVGQGLDSAGDIVLSAQFAYLERQIEEKTQAALESKMPEIERQQKQGKWAVAFVLIDEPAATNPLSAVVGPTEAWEARFFKDVIVAYGSTEEEAWERLRQRDWWADGRTPPSERRRWNVQCLETFPPPGAQSAKDRENDAIFNSLDKIKIPTHADISGFYPAYEVRDLPRVAEPLDINREILIRQSGEDVRIEARDPRTGEEYMVGPVHWNSNLGILTTTFQKPGQGHRKINSTFILTEDSKLLEYFEYLGTDERGSTPTTGVLRWR